MLGFKKKKKSQDLDITNVATLKLVEQGTSTKKLKNTPTSKRGKKTSALTQEPVTSPQGRLDQSIEARIAIRAYEIYEERCRLGASQQDWLRAEREVLAMVEYES